MQVKDDAYGAVSLRVASFLMLWQSVYYSEARCWLSQVKEEAHKQAKSKQCHPTVWGAYITHLLVLSKRVRCHAIHCCWCGNAFKCCIRHLGVMFFWPCRS